MRISDWSSDVCSSDLTLDEVRNQRALHAPLAAGLLGLAERLHCDGTVIDRVRNLVGQPQGQGALGPLYRQHAVVNVSGDAARDRHRPFADAAHQNTSASTSPPTFSVRASLSESTPLGVETMVMPRSEEHTSELQSLMRIPYAV